MSSSLSPNFWQEHFDKGHTPWDRSDASPQLRQWLDSGELKPCRIAVPGCGKGWEVAELAGRGFDTIGIDYTAGAVQAAQSLLVQRQLSAKIIQADVLTYVPDAPFDAVYEQTCLCALDPDHWIAYTEQLARWIRPGGSLYILFMQVERPGARQGLKQGPPFHCDINAMHALFNSRLWRWPETLPTQVSHPSGWHELAIRLQRKH